MKYKIAKTLRIIAEATNIDLQGSIRVDIEENSLTFLISDDLELKMIKAILQKHDINYTQLEDDSLFYIISLKISDFMYEDKHSVIINFLRNMSKCDIKSFAYAYINVEGNNDLANLILRTTI